MSKLKYLTSSKILRFSLNIGVIIQSLILNQCGNFFLESYILLILLSVQTTCSLLVILSLSKDQYIGGEQELPAARLTVLLDLLYGRSTSHDFIRCSHKARHFGTRYEESDKRHTKVQRKLEYNFETKLQVSPHESFLLLA